MPIQFMPPEPFSGEGGAAQEISRGTAELSQIYQTASRAAEAAADRQNRAAIASAEMSNSNAQNQARNELAWANLYQNAAESNAARMQSAMQHAAAQAQAQQEMAQRAAMQAAAQEHAAVMQRMSQDFHVSQAERLRLQQIDSGMAQVRALHAQGVITDEQLGQLTTLANRGADPIRYMIAAENLQQERAQTQRAVQVAALGTAMTTGNAAEVTRLLGSRFHTHRHADGSETEFFIDMSGNPHPIRQHNPPLDNRALEAEADDLLAAWGGAMPGASQATSPQAQRDFRRFYVASQHRARQDRIDAARRASTVTPPDRGVFFGWGRGDQDAQPISITDPSDWNQRQAARMRNFNNAEARVETLPEGQREAYRSAIGHARMLYAHYGSVEAMRRNPQDLQTYEDILRLMDSLLQQDNPPPAAPARFDYRGAAARFVPMHP